MEAFEKFKKDYEARMAIPKEINGKLKDFIKVFVKTSHGVIDATTESFKNMIDSLEE